MNKDKKEKQKTPKPSVSSDKLESELYTYQNGRYAEIVAEKLRSQTEATINKNKPTAVPSDYNLVNVPSNTGAVDTSGESNVTYNPTTIRDAHKVSREEFSTVSMQSQAVQHTNMFFRDRETPSPETYQKFLIIINNFLTKNN